MHKASLNVVLPTLFSILLASLGTSAFATDVAIPAPEELGLNFKAEDGPQNSRTELLIDKESGAEVRMSFNALGLPTETKILDRDQNTTQITRYLPAELWKWERQGAGYEINRWLTSTPGSLTTRKTVFYDGNSFTSTYETQEQHGLEQVSCDGAPAHPQLDALAQSLSNWLPVKHQIGDAKIDISGCTFYPGDERNLLNEMKDALNKGLTCMAKGSVQTRTEGATLLGYFKNPKSHVNLSCALSDTKFKMGGTEMSLPGSVRAQALIPPLPGSPGLAINLTNMKEADDRKIIFFHEMLHWLGIRHNEGFDTPYIASICCLGSPAAEDTKIACDLLKKEPRPDANSAEYLTRFAALMEKNQRPFIASNAVITAAIQAEKQKKNSDLAALAFAARTMSDLRDPMGLVLESMVDHLSSQKMQASSTTAKFSPELAHLANTTGSIAALIVSSSDYPQFKAQMQKLTAETQTYLSHFSGKAREDEAWKIKQWFTAFDLVDSNVQKPKNPKDAPAFSLWGNFESQVK